MDIALRIVTTLPLVELWRVDGFTTTARVRDLTAEDIVELLRVGPVQFVVADLGGKLNWIPPDESVDYWKSEVRAHLRKSNDERVRLEHFPGEYFYDASEWADAEGRPPIVVLEKHH